MKMYKIFLWNVKKRMTTSDDQLESVTNFYSFYENINGSKYGKGHKNKEIPPCT